MTKIERIETYLAPQQAVVRVLTDDGAEGIGQTSPYRADITVDVLHKMVAPFFLGKNPWDLERLGEECLRRLHKFPGSYVHRALAGVDTALWDLNARCAGQPVYRLLGGADRRDVPMYASSMRRETSPEDEVDRIERAVEESGFRCAKIKIADMMGRDADPIPGRTKQLIPLMRERMGGEFDINADANGGYSPAEAIRVGRLLEEHGYYHYEEPCPFTQLESTATVAAALDIPVAGGEQDYSLDQFHRMIAMRAVDIVQPDIGYIGGITPARKVAFMAEAAGIPCTPHCANQSMLQVFTLHLTAAMPACTQYQEWSIEDTQGWASEIYEPALTVEGGVVSVSDKPGWGVSILPSYLKNAEQQASTC
jgi:L-alanine-DL-glutamate epimerase-like enolase superfamily enzyme